MKHHLQSLRAISLAVAGCCFLVGCDPPASKKTGETTSVHLVTQPDGLAYAPGSPTPYTGEVTVFTAAHTRQTVETWEDGKLHGPWTRYWSNGQLKREDTHQHGLITHRRQWFENGTLKLDAEMKNGVGYGKIRLWWPDGRLRRSVLVGDELRPHGHVLEYAEDGTLIADAIFDHGQYVSGKVPPQDTVAKTITAQTD